MSHKASTWAWSQTGLTPGEKLTLLALADGANDDGACWPSRRVIAEKVGCDEASVRKRYRALEERGLLRVDERYRENGSQTTSFYTLVMEGGVTTTPGGGHHDPPGGSGAPPLEPSVETGSSPSAQNLVSSTATMQLVDEEVILTDDPVQVVWQHYVAKRESTRLKLGPEEKAVILSALKVATVEECIAAIDGCWRSDYHQKRGRYANRDGATYNALSQILKGKRGGRTTREQIDFFIGMASGGVTDNARGPAFQSAYQSPEDADYWNERARRPKGRGVGSSE